VSSRKPEFRKSAPGSEAAVGGILSAAGNQIANLRDGCAPGRKKIKKVLHSILSLIISPLLVAEKRQDSMVANR